MARPDAYPAGVPCWVDSFQPDAGAAAEFYGGLLGWELDAPVDGYRVARVDGRAVAGIAQAPETMPTGVWSTYVSVTDADDAVARATGAGAMLLMDPTDAGPAGRFAVLADPDGVAFGVWQAGERAGAELVNDPGSWAMSVLHAKPAGAWESFYPALFGWQLNAAEGMPLSLWRLPGYVGGEEAQPVPRDVVAVASPIEPGSPVPPHWAVNFRVASADAVAERAPRLGGSVLMAPASAGGFRNALIGDPAGGVIAISEIVA